MLVNRNTFNQYTKEEILDGAESGELIIQTANFFEKIVILIVQGIAERKAKVKKRVEELEANQSKLIARIDALELKAGIVAPVAKSR